MSFLVIARVSKTLNVRATEERRSAGEAGGRRSGTDSRGRVSVLHGAAVRSKRDYNGGGGRTTGGGGIGSSGSPSGVGAGSGQDGRSRSNLVGIDEESDDDLYDVLRQNIILEYYQRPKMECPRHQGNDYLGNGYGYFFAATFFKFLSIY